MADGARDYGSGALGVNHATCCNRSRTGCATSGAQKPGARNARLSCLLNRRAAHANYPSASIRITPQHDVDVRSQQRKHAHQPLGREPVDPAVEEAGYFGRCIVHEPSGCGTTEVSLRNRAPNLAAQLIARNHLRSKLSGLFPAHCGPGCGCANGQCTRFELGQDYDSSVGSRLR
jgi:hypothetical protein